MIKECKHKLTAFCMKYDCNIEEAEKYHNIRCCKTCSEKISIYTGQERLIIMKQLYNDLMLNKYNRRLKHALYQEFKNKSYDINSREQISAEMTAISLIYQKKWKPFLPEEFCYYFRLMQILHFHIPKAARRRYKRLNHVDFVGRHLQHARSKQ